MEIKMADIIQWDKVMGKKVRSIDGEDLGNVIWIKRGTLIIL
jgi:hypothetical protein